MAQLTGVTLLAVGGLAVALSPGAQAATLSSGPVTITTTGPVTASTPFSSGQVIDISVTTNSTMNNASLTAAGFPSGAVSIKALECADPGGLLANLPTKPTECQPDTIQSIAGAATDGSMSFPSYTVYALPDAISLGEPTNGTPVCDNGDACVIGLFSNQNDFSKPHLFTAPFYVAANADDGGENPGDGSQLAATAVSAGLSTVAASPPTATADGVDSSKVTVTLEDTNGIPVTGGKQVTLTQGSGHSTISVGGVVTDTATTDATTGIASFTIADTTTEPVTYTATDTTDSVTLTSTPVVSFVAPVVTTANSSVAASASTVTLGGSTTITVTLMDQAVAPQPVAGKMVSLSDGSGHAIITAVAATTNTSGQATFTATDTTNEVVTFTATDTTDSVALTGKSASVTFGTVAVSAGLSTVSASPTVVSSLASAGVLPTGIVTVTLLAGDGTSPVSGKTVSLTASSSTAQITPATTPDVTDAEGKATFAVGDATSEAVTFSATDVTDDIPITSGAVVTFEPPSASSSASVLTASVSTAPADGVTAVALTVTLKDQFGHPLAGKVVTVTGSPSTTTRVAPQTESTSVPAGTTDATGKATFDAYDTTAEAVTYTASDTSDGVTLTQTQNVTFTATAAQANNCTVSASPSDVAADGKTSSTVTVTLEDHNSNPVPGKVIALAGAEGNSTVTPMSPTTNSQGQATFGVTDATSEVVMYTATDTTDNLVLAGQGATVTFGTPPPVTPATADSTVVVEPAQVPADGSTSATITVVLSDADGNALPGKTVALNPSSGDSSVTTVSGTTDDNGEALFTVTDKTAQAVTYTATDVTDNLPISGQSVMVTFTTPSGSSGTGGQTSTTATSPTTTSAPSAGTATVPTTPSPASASETASAESAGSSDSSASTVVGSSGGTLALTGAPGLLPGVIGLGCILLALGTIGRLRLARVPVANAATRSVVNRRRPRGADGARSRHVCPRRRGPGSFGPHGSGVTAPVGNLAAGAPYTPTSRWPSGTNSQCLESPVVLGVTVAPSRPPTEGAS